MYKKIVIERTRDLIYLKFVATDFSPKITSPSTGDCYSAVSALSMNPLPDRSNYSPLCHTHYLTADQYFTSLFAPDPLPSRELEQTLLNSKGYAESPEFSQALGLIIFGEKSVATNLR